MYFFRGGMVKYGEDAYYGQFETPRNSYFANHQNALKGKIPIKKGSRIGEKFDLS